MKKVALYIDSCADLPEEEIQSIGLDVIPLYYYFDEENIEYGDKLNLSMREYFNKIKQGYFPRTSSCNVDKIYNRFKKDIIDGKDIICVNISSKLSCSYNNCLLAAEMIKEEFKDANIQVFDSLSASLGEALTLYDILNSKNLDDESIKHIRDNIKFNHVEFFCDELTYLVKNGRLSKMGCFLGKTLNIKPLISTNKNGEAELVTKVRGEKKVFDTLINRMINTISDTNVIGVVHSDSIDKAYILKEKVEQLKIAKKIVLSEIGPVIASHVGPGAVGLAYKMHR